MVNYLRRFWICFVILLVVLPVAAQEETVPYLPIERITDDPLEVTDFASDGTAVLRVVTDAPLACSLVYGKTEDFGSIAVDMDMAGGAHSDHHPILSGLEPETTYYYRMQGFDAEGNLYLSDVMTFTVPAFEAEEVTNLASPALGGEIVGYSSAFGDAEPDATWGVDSAFDGSANSAWSSAGDGDEAWVEVKLAQRSRVDAVAFWSRSMSDGSARVTEFTVTTDSGETYGPFSLPDADEAYRFDVEFEAETLRFDVASSTGGNTGAIEIGVYGEPVDE
ncbi:MAG: discoidin domain-containing protein [Anaerolineae bacterium]|nr:discoidin domain-containing protein [Anaerolineae bacterium]